MIEVTDEMERAYDDAAWENPIELGGAYMADVRAGLAAALAIVERDHDVTPKLPEFEHKPRGGVFWNEYANEYQAECTCGQTFGGRKAEVEHRILDHVEERPA
jgi:hypothetical protein